MPSGLLEKACDTTSAINQDLYLTSNPTITFFKSVYYRYTNFAIESINLQFDSNVKFGSECLIKIPRIGDLMSKTYLKVTIPEINIPRKLPSPIYGSQYAIAVNNYNSTLKFMEINISAYRNGMASIALSNSTTQDVVDAIINTFSASVTFPIVKTNFIAALSGSPFIITETNLNDMIDLYVDAFNNVLPTVTKSDLEFLLLQAQLKSTEIQNYFFKETQKYAKLVKDETNTTAKGAWIKHLGHFIFDYVLIRIGGIEIDKQYGEWMHIWNSLSMDVEKQRSYNKMIGNVDILTTTERTIKPQYTMHIPLSFWFCKNIGLALPLIALQHDIVTLEVKFKKFSECFYYTELTQTELNDPVTRNNRIDELGLIDLDSFIDNSNVQLYAELLVDYIYLDKNERCKVASNCHEYLIEQTQMISFDNQLSQSFYSYDLNFNLACKELFWIIQNNKLTTVTDNNDVLEWDNFVDNNNAVIACSLRFQDMAVVELNDSKYFNCVQPYKLHTATPPDGIFIHSFCLKPEEFQPTGNANLWMIAKVSLDLQTNNDMIDPALTSSSTYATRIYAVTNNVLRFISGRAAPAFTY